MLLQSRRWTASRPLLADLALAAALTGASVVQGFQEQPHRWHPYDLPATVVTIAATMPTALRRRAPVPVFLICLAFWGWYAAEGYFPPGNTYAVMLALYTVASICPNWTIFGCTVASSSAYILSSALDGGDPLLVVVAQSVVIPTVVWKIGDSAKQLAAGNRRLAAAGEELARRAVLDERVRIARELHDVVAHHMSVIAVQAGLARYVLRTDPDTATSALDTVLDTGAEALDELRRLLELLRIGAADSPGPAPGLAYLPELFNRVRVAGVPVEVTVTGTPHPLPSGPEVCVFRIVQESLTNVLRHAAPATAAVHLDYGTDELRVTVTDDGTRTPTGRPGNGLIGMRERATLYGGTLHAASRDDGPGFEVRLVLPVPPRREP